MSNKPCDKIRCSKCNLEKCSSEFPHKSGGRYMSYCKCCFYLYQAIRWNRIKAQLVQYKGGKCAKCGATGHPVIFDFHHRDPSKKDFSISAKRNTSFSYLKQEIDKCDLLCACCHRIEHTNQLAWDFDWNNKYATKPVKHCKCGAIIKNWMVYCSAKCSQRNREVIPWPDNLPQLVAATSKRSVALALGVSDKAVAKRLLHHH